MIRTQAGPDNHYSRVTAARRVPARRRGVPAARADRAVNPRSGIADESAPREPQRSGSFVKGFMIGLPLSLALWAAVIWVVWHFL